MATKIKTLLKIKVILGLIVLLGIVFLPAVHASPLPQGADPRPSDEGDDGGQGGGNGNGSGGAGAASDTCASLVGQVINWGAGGEGGVTTELDAGSWQLTTVSATDGNYAFGGLGVGPAILRTVLSPEQAEHLQPLIQNAGVYLNCDFPIFANIAVSGDVSNIDPPATIQMSASRTTLIAGQQAELMLTINNDLPNEITNVVVTNLLTPELTPVGVSAAVGPEVIKIVDVGVARQMVVVNLDTLASGAEATIQMTVAADEDLLPTAELKSTATLFYRESAAHQAVVDFSAGASPAPVVATPTTPATLPTPAADALTPPTPTAEPTVEPTAEAMPSPEPAAEAETGEDFVPPNGLPTTGDIPSEDSFVPPPDMLPLTGQDTLLPTESPNKGLSPIWPLSGLGLAGLVFALHQLRIGQSKD